MRILVVEDDSLLAATVCDLLVLEGFEVSHAAVLSEVEAQLAGSTYDLVLTDVSIADAVPSDMDYFSLLRVWAPGAAVVAMTGDAKSVYMTASESGLDDLISKPFEIEELLRAIHGLLARRRPSGPPER